MISKALITIIPVNFLQQLLDYVKNENYGEISTVVGRYYAMDRDKRWERIRVRFNKKEICQIYHFGMNFFTSI